MRYLCTGSGDARSRVRGAADYLAFLREEDFPEHLQADYRCIISQATKFAPDIPNYSKEGCIDATMRRVNNSTAEQIAKRVFKLYSDVQDIRGFPLLEYRSPNE